MKKKVLFSTLGILSAVTLAVPSVNYITAQNMTQPEQVSAQEKNTGETAGSASDISTRDVECTAKSLKADYTAATTIVMTDSNKKVEITKAGTYVITGTCTDGNISVKKGTTGVVLVLKNLTLTSTTGAAVSVNKGAQAAIVIEGSINLTDAENPEDENSTDADVADAFDGAALKVKDGANVYLSGSGTLTINGSCKNGIKSGDEAGTCLVIDGPEIIINAANDGINAGYDLTILSGKLTVTAADDAIHADRILTIGADGTDGPTIVVTNSSEGLEGTVVNIFSGNITVKSSDDAINAANKNGTYVSELAYSINITGGTVSVDASGDGLDSNGNVNLIGGNITIKSASAGGEAGIDYDGTYYISDDVVLNNSSGVSGADMMPGQMGQNGQMGKPGENGRMGRPGESDQNGQSGQSDQSGQSGMMGQPGQPGEMGQNGQPGGSSSSVTYEAEETISTDTKKSGQSITAQTADVSALIVSGANVTEDGLSVKKTGSSDGGDNCNFYGQNAAVLAKDGAVLNITNADIYTNASGANGVFSYGGNGGQNGASGDGTTVNISDSVIVTEGSGSGGIMTTGGGITNAENLTVTTSGQSSAAIRTDRGGGTVNVDGGTYTTNGLGSPAIYSTADITVKNAKLVSTLSEGVVIEGKNTVTLENVDLTANNTKTNGNATHYDTIFMYQSMSGDADSGTSTFTMTGGSLTSRNGEVFHVTNTNAVINLNNVTITNKDSDNVLLTVTNDGWSGADNIAAVNAKSQKLKGNIVVSNAAVKDDNASTLTLNLTKSSSFTGSINTSEENPGTVNVSIDKTSTWKLTADSYVTSVTGSGCIDYNGYTLYVGNTAYTDSNPLDGFMSADTTSSGKSSKAVFKNCTKKLSAASLKTSNKKYSVIKASDAGEVSVVKYCKNAADYISVSSTGKVTVRKGTPAGTYNVKIKIATANGTKTKTIKIKVK